MENANQKTILVISATGTQGRPVVKRLLQKGFSVRILVRNPDSSATQELIKAGAKPFKGDLADLSSLEVALKGVNAVYSILPVDMGDEDLERTGGLALINAAVKAGVEQFVHASVASAGTHESFPNWGTGYWNEKYWTIKWDVEEAIRKAGFAYWTILKPVSFMENFLPPVRDIMYPKLKEGKLVTILRRDKKNKFITVEDIAKYALEAFEDPKRFNHQSIEVAAEALTTDEIAATLTKVLGKKFQVVLLSSEQALKEGVHPLAIRSFELCNVTDVYHADFEILKQYGIPLTSFEEWLKAHRDQFNDIINA